MFHLESLEIFQYKNHYRTVIEFDSSLNILIGENGSGKTNVLDAIYNICLSKSAISSQEAYCVQFGTDFFSLKGVFNKNNRIQVVTSSFKVNEGKRIFVDQSLVERAKDFIGLFPCVMINPDDISIIKGGSEERRKFFDGTFGLSNSAFLVNLLNYQKLLKQRNSLLKMFIERRYKDLDLLDTYTLPMIQLADEINKQRNEMLADFLPEFIKWYRLLSNDREVPSLIFEHDSCDTGYAQIFRESQQDDLRSGRTTKGIHTDEFQFFINESLVRKTGSQGQQKTYLLALKLAQYEFVRNVLGVSPLLLLDDIFDKLDEHRADIILKTISENKLGQAFITDAQSGRTLSRLKKSKLKNKVFRIEKGEVKN